ncbi:hypothetical protein G4D82_04930 [Flavobacterium sp. CYK-4]|uniref:hypothetical protein n=1 Tax=Flavobacterium lotistagni TaxID=2709660 RepID=UPI00140BD535|nr:hypothetical protein [Flavobacterium lotistagni]NHM06556.1 hypothetical protein [Flavobacterium lotistagni]
MKSKAAILFLLFNVSLYGQFKTDLSPMVNYHSPNAATLGSFGDTPVSLYNGTPEIKVPIYKFNERGIELDINLEYNPRGVRVEDVPGWVGQNWALNAGGLITRSVRGTAFDELNFFHNKDINQQITPYLVEWPTSIGGGNWYPGIFQRGYFYHANKLNTSEWNTPAYLNDLAFNSYLNFTSQNYMQVWREQNWRMDLEPDLFTFNFMGHSGHFFLGQDGKWKVFSNSNFKVECDLNNDISYPVPSVPASGPDGLSTNPFMIRYPKVIQKITLVDDNGTRYLFSQVELTFNNITVQRPPYNKDSRCISSAFYLTEVVDVYKNKIYEFEYEKGPWQGKFSVSYNVNMYYNDDSPSVSNTAISTFNPSIIDWHKFGFSAPGQLILPCYLKKIKCISGAEIEFNSTLVENALKYTRGGNSLIDNRTETYYGTYTSNNVDLYFLFKNPDLVTDNNIPTSTPLWDLIKNKKLTDIVISDNSDNEIQVNFDYIDTSGIRLFLSGLNFNGTKKYKFDYNGYFLPSFLEMQTDALGYYNNLPFKFTVNFNDVNYWTNELPLMRQTNSNILIGTLSKITYPTGGYTQFEFEPHVYSKKLNENNQLINSSGTIGGLRIKKIVDSFDNSTETKEYLYQKAIDDNSSSGNLIYNPIYFKNLESISHPLQNILNGSNMYCRSLNSMVSMSNFMGAQVEYTDVIEKISGKGFSHYKFSGYEDYPDINPVLLHSTGNIFTPKIDQSYARGKLTEKNVYNEDGSIIQKKEYRYFANNSLFVNAVNINFSYNIPCVGCGGMGDTFWFLPFTSAYQRSYTDNYLIEEKESLYTTNGLISTIKANDYVQYPTIGGTIPNNGSIYKKKEYKSNSGQTGLLKTFNYPFDLGTPDSDLMINKNLLPILQETNQEIEGNMQEPENSLILDEKKLVYAYDNPTELLVPKESFFRKGDNNFESEFIYTTFDNRGNVLEYKKNDGIPVSVIWGYNQNKPIAIIENVNYSEIPINIVENLTTLSDADKDHGINGQHENALRVGLNSLRDLFPLAMIKTITYDPLTGPTSFTGYDRLTQYYEYDDLLRLKIIRNKQGEILEEYHYNYRPIYNPED